MNKLLNTTIGEAALSMNNLVPFTLATIVAFLIYLVLSIGSSGDANSILFWSAPELIIGLILSIITGMLCRSLWRGKRYVMINPLRWMLLVIYIIPFVIELIFANLTVAWKIISGRNIRPGIIKLTPGMKTDAGALMLSVSITFQPGTVTVDINEGTRELYVHCLDIGDFSEKYRNSGDIFAKFNLAKWIRRITE
jgi:multicomponent Na+:H+ antiporter subunit E